MSEEQPEALRLADECEESARAWANEVTTRQQAAAELRRLHDELQECRDQRRAAFRRIEELDRELDAMRAQIGQGVPDVDDLRHRLVAISSAIGDSDDIEAQAIIRTTLEMLASAPPAPQQKPLTDEQIVDAYCKERGMRQYVEAYVAGARFAEAAHDIK